MEKERSLGNLVNVWEGRPECASDGMNGEDSGIDESRPASPDFEESVEKSVEVIDESTHVKYDESAEENGELGSNDETEDCAAEANAEMLRDNGDLQKKEQTTACGKLNHGKGGKRKSTDEKGDEEKKVKESSADGEEWLHLNLEKSVTNSPTTHVRGACVRAQRLNAARELQRELSEFSQDLNAY